MKKLLALPAIVALLVVVVPALAATKSVKIGDNYFVRAGHPPTVTVKRGTVVKWVWRGHAPHNVTVRSGPQRFHSSTKVSGSFRHKMRRGGKYRIVCTIHPGMEMTLKVR